MRTLALLTCLLCAPAMAAPAPAPCEDLERLREFDFWVGHWAVHTADGALAGHNRIEYAEQGCRVEEYWTSAGGGTGRGINFLDPVDGRWEQVWHSANGAFIRIRGGLTGEHDMQLEGTIHYFGRDLTAPFRGRWTLLEDGRVRQFFEQYDETGEAWQPWFEGFYTRSEGDAR